MKPLCVSLRTISLFQGTPAWISSGEDLKITFPGCVRASAFKQRLVIGHLHLTPLDQENEFYRPEDPIEQMPDIFTAWTISFSWPCLRDQRELKKYIFSSFSSKSSSANADISLFSKSCLSALLRSHSLVDKVLASKRMMFALPDMVNKLGQTWLVSGAVVLLNSTAQRTSRCFKNVKSEGVFLNL